MVTVVFRVQGYRSRSYIISTIFLVRKYLMEADIRNHRCIVFLAENDSIITASKVLTYLHGGTVAGRERSSTAEIWQQHQETSRLIVVWWLNLDHGQVFGLSTWRARLSSKILQEARRFK